MPAERLVPWFLAPPSAWPPSRALKGSVPWGLPGAGRALARRDRGEAVFLESAGRLRGAQIVEKGVGRGRVRPGELGGRVDDRGMAVLREESQDLHIGVGFRVACIDDPERDLATGD